MAFTVEESPKLLADLVKNGYIIKEYVIIKDPEIKIKFKSMIAGDWVKVPRFDSEGRILDSRELDLRDIAAHVISFGDATFNSPEAAYEALKHQSFAITNKIASKLVDFNTSIFELIQDEEVKKN
jgi:hypothetical protein